MKITLTYTLWKMNGETIRTIILVLAMGINAFVTYRLLIKTKVKPNKSNTPVNDGRGIRAMLDDMRTAKEDRLVRLENHFTKKMIEDAKEIDRLKVELGKCIDSRSKYMLKMDELRKLLNKNM